MKDPLPVSDEGWWTDIPDSANIVNQFINLDEDLYKATETLYGDTGDMISGQVNSSQLQNDIDQYSAAEKALIDYSNGLSSGS